VTEVGPLTSELLWRSAVVAALIDAPLLVLVARCVPSDLFRQLKWYLAGAAFVLYAALWDRSPVGVPYEGDPPIPEEERMALQWTAWRTWLAERGSGGTAEAPR